MRFVINEQITVYDPEPWFVMWLKKEYTIDNPEYEKKLRMGFWTGNTPKTIQLFSQEGDTYILPQGLQHFFPTDMWIDSEICIDTDYPIPQYTVESVRDIELYEYQKKALYALRLYRRGILQSPPGSGKTQMGLAFIQALGERALWITHTIDLMKQSKYRAELYFKKSTLGEITGGKCHLGTGITFATVQTLANIDLAKYKNYWNVIVVDECHRVSGSPTTMTRYYKVLNNLNAEHKIGLSATVHRADGMIKATHALLGRTVHTVSEDDVKDKTMPVKVIPVGTGTPLSMDMLNTDGTLHYSNMLNCLAEDKDRCSFIVKLIMENKDHSCLILSERLLLLENLMSLMPPGFREDAVLIHGGLTNYNGKSYREQAIQDMRTGKKKYLFATFQLAKEGLDIPKLDRLFLTTPQKDYAVVAQSIGRIARVAEGKTDAIAYDFIDDFPYAKKAFKKRLTTYNKQGCEVE